MTSPTPWTTDRFEITSGLVLKLKDGTSLDHETEDSVTLTLTASDPAGNTSGAPWWTSRSMT